MTAQPVAQITPELLAVAGTEQALQTAYFAWLSPLTRDPNNIDPATGINLYSLVHAIPSGGHRERIVATMMKAAGVRPGILDISIPVARGSYHYAYIEMKRPIYRHRPQQGLSDAQIAFGKAQLKLGAYMRVAFDWTEARDYTVEYFNLGS